MGNSLLPSLAIGAGRGAQLIGGVVGISHVQKERETKERSSADWVGKHLAGECHGGNATAQVIA